MFTRNDGFAPSFLPFKRTWRIPKADLLICRLYDRDGGGRLPARKSSSLRCRRRRSFSFWLAATAASRSMTAASSPSALRITYASFVALPVGLHSGKKTRGADRVVFPVTGSCFTPYPPLSAWISILNSGRAYHPPWSLPTPNSYGPTDPEIVKPAQLFIEVGSMMLAFVIETVWRSAVL